MENIVIQRCETYDYPKVQKAVFDCLDAIPEIKAQIGKGARVLVKTNLLMRKSPDDAVTTHPTVIEAIVRYLQSLDCEVIVGDSPGGPFTEKMLRSVYKASGMTEMAERTGCTLNFDVSVVEVKNDKARLLKTMQIIKAAHDVDFVISAAKLKTHGMMTYTGAVKNLFGVIPGLTKAEYHFKMNNVDNFAGHLVDICEYINPVFSIIDGVEGMEGDGPSAGDKRHVGLIMASKSPYTLDTAAAHIIGLKPLDVPTIREAKARGLHSGSVADVSAQGVALKDIKIAPFKLPKSISINFTGTLLPKFMEKPITKVFRPKPIFDLEKCVACGDCKRSCPPDVIDMSSGKPVVNLEKCIRCFCCHELCPKKAVDIKKHWLHEKLFK